MLWERAMSDIVEKLRFGDSDGDDHDAAADEIESLRSRLAEETKRGDSNLASCFELQEMLGKVQARLAEADIEATMLVVAMADQYGAPGNWKPLPDVAGKITQISNMVAGLRSRLAEADALLLITWELETNQYKYPVDDYGDRLQAYHDAHLAREQT